MTYLHDVSEAPIDQPRCLVPSLLTDGVGGCWIYYKLHKVRIPKSKVIYGQHFYYSRQCNKHSHHVNEEDDLDGFLEVRTRAEGVDDGTVSDIRAELKSFRLVD